MKFPPLLSLSLTFSLAGLLAAAPLHAADPDYSAWNALLSGYYSPEKGMDYAGLKAKEQPRLDSLRGAMAKVRIAELNPKELQAYWINLYNITVTGMIADHYPLGSIKDLSTGINPYSVFKKDWVRWEGGKMSLDTLEVERIRKGFKDPRIHFAVNCAARSCPALRTEAYTGARLDEQLDDQVRRFLAGPNGARLQSANGKVTIRVTKILKWFKEDFDQWGGGGETFVKKYLSAAQQKQVAAAGGKVRLEFDDYDWKLNDWKH